MSSLLDRARPPRGFEAYFDPAYLRFFGGPGIAPHVRKSSFLSLSPPLPFQQPDHTTSPPPPPPSPT